MCLRDVEGRFVLAKTLWSRPICSTGLCESHGIASSDQFGA